MSNAPVWPPIPWRPPLPAGWRWPDGSSLAVWVVPNLETFDPAYPMRSGGPVPDTLGLAERQYGNRVGLDRIRNLLRRYDLLPTAAVNSALAQESPQLLRDLVAEGWEIIGHGEVNNRFLPSYPPEQERATIADSLAALAAVTGQRPRGWLSPGLRQTRHTLTHLADEGVRYVADWVNDDRPYHLGNTGLVSIPYTVEANDKTAYDRRGLTPDEFVMLVRRQFDFLHAESQHTPAVFTLALHPYLSGVPHRMAATEAVLQHLRSRDGVWFATGSEIVDAYLTLTGQPPDRA
jgi:allantoinase